MQLDMDVSTMGICGEGATQQFTIMRINSYRKLEFQALLDQQMQL